MKIRGQWVNGEVHLSLTTIKQILTTDLVSYLESKAAGYKIPTSAEYIKNFLERLDKVNTWEMF